MATIVRPFCFIIVLFSLFAPSTSFFHFSGRLILSKRYSLSSNASLYRDTRARSTISDENVNSNTTPSPKLPIVEQFEDYTNVQELKKKILHLAALTNRGDLHSESVGRGGIYRERKNLMLTYVDDLLQKRSKTVAISDCKLLEGEWELVYANAQLFRSSPFFLAIQTAFNSTEKSELFFRLHELQVMSFGISSIGRITQEIILPSTNLEADDIEESVRKDKDTENDSLESQSNKVVFEKSGKFISSFDTTIFPLTAIPIVGFWKLLPTFGGKVITKSILEKIDEVSGVLDLEVETTSFSKIDGINYMPLLGKTLENKEVPVGKIWPRLPWNKGSKAKTTITIKYLDEDMRISEDASGAIYIYTRPI